MEQRRCLFFLEVAGVPLSLGWEREHRVDYIIYDILHRAVIAAYHNDRTAGTEHKHDVQAKAVVRLARDHKTSFGGY